MNAFTKSNQFINKNKLIMSELRKITIQYNGGGVSEATYNGYSSTQKSTYRNFLTSLNTSTYKNAQWIISHEIYIPSGVILEIPENVTLVADGGLFSGTGTLAGNFTKIKAGFEQIFEDTVNFRRINGTDKMYQWDVKLSHPEWFGVTLISRRLDTNFDVQYEELPNNMTDDSIKIQKAIDIVSTSSYSTDTYIFNGDKSQLYAGGRTICKPYSLYNIKKTIYLPLGVSFDGNHSNFIYSCPIGNYIFKININKNNEDWEHPQRGHMDTISNIRMINPKSIADAFGIYSASQVCTFENIESFHMCQTFKRHSEYLDNLTLRNFNINAGKKSSDNRYQIEISYIGDNLLLDNMAFTYEREEDNNKSIYVNACGGGLIQRITNGTIEIKNSKALTLSGVHQEFGNIILENTQIEINGFCHFKTPGLPAIKIKKREAPNGVWDQRSISIKNGMILYDGATYYKEKDYQITGKIGYPNFSDELDIQLGWVSGAVKIENVFRAPRRDYTEASSLFGITINNTQFMKNSAANSLSSIVNGSSDTTGETTNWDESNRGVLINKHISYQINDYGTVLRDFYPVNEDLGTNAPTPYFQLGTYYYYACVLLDRDRNIGYTFPDHEQRKIDIGTSGATKMILSFYRHYYLGMYIRVFRKKRGSNKVYYLDIPVCTSFNDIVDLNEKTEYGDIWKEINGVTDVFDSNNNMAFTQIIPQRLLPQTCYNYQNLGNNVIVKMPQAPDLSRGTWERGDMIYLENESRYMTI